MTNAIESDATTTTPVNVAPDAKGEAPRGRHSLPDRWGFCRRAIEIAYWFAVIAGLGMAVVELRTTRDDRRVDATLKFAERFVEGRAGEFRRLLQDRWLQQSELVEKLQSSRASRSTLDDFVRLVILTGDTPEETRKLRIAVGEVADVLDQMALCVENRQCDEKTAAEYFCAYTTSFYDLYASTLDETNAIFVRPEAEKAGRSTLGMRLERFSSGEPCINLQ